MDDLGDRMKKYEKAWSNNLPPNSWVVMRLDGRAFHTWTRRARKPFDDRVIESMRHATGRLAEEIPGFKIGYTQSDEATIVFTDTDNYNSELWFGGKIQKIVSVAASSFTSYFTQYHSLFEEPVNMKSPTFDCRVFSMPKDDVPNIIFWRQKDWERNSLQMYARSIFSHKDLFNKNASQIHEMLHIK